VVRAATEFYLGGFLADQFHRLVDEVADGDAGRREQFHPADLPGVFSDELHGSFGTRPHGQMDFLLALPVNTRFLVSLRVVDLGAFVNALFGLCVLIFATRERECIQRPFKCGGFSALCIVGILIHYSLMFILASISFGRCGGRASYGLLQSVQHRADAGRGVSRRVQGGVHVRAAGAAGEQRADARADEHARLGGVMAVAARRWGDVGADFRMVLAAVHQALHKREFVK